MASRSFRLAQFTLGLTLLITAGLARGAEFRPSEFESRLWVEPIERLCVPSPATPTPWKGVFYDNDFSYKSKPDHLSLFGEEWKDVPLSGGLPSDLFDESTISFGGELRYRYMDERNRLRGPAGHSTYDLWRWRNYVDFKMNDDVRVYGEMLDAAIFNEELSPTPIDLNRWNLQQLFLDFKVADLPAGPVYFRVGRQELLYGSQHVVSPLDWGNTRRNFEGLKLFYRGEDWNIDAFSTRPVNTATGRPLPPFDHESDKADTTRWFNGVYASYRGIPQQTIDLYWLWLLTDPGFDKPTYADGNRHTTGLRWQGTRAVESTNPLLAQIWKNELEGAYQFGNDNRQRVQAGFITNTVSVGFPKVPWSPQLIALYYWGSGDHNPHDGRDSTFDTLFPLGHAYWGFIDNLSGQNLNDLSVQATLQPTKQLNLLAAMHWFDLDSNHDFLYTVSGAPAGTPGSGTEVGEELDLVATYAFNPNWNVQAGYFWFWYGTYVNNSLPRNDANEFYVQTILRY